VCARIVVVVGMGGRGPWARARVDTAAAQRAAQRSAVRSPSRSRARLD